MTNNMGIDDLRELIEYVQHEVPGINHGSDDYPIWLHIDLDTEGDWKVYIAPTEVHTAYWELIHRGDDAMVLQEWLHDLEGYGQQGGIYVEATRIGFAGALAEWFGRNSFGPEGETFGLSLDVYHFGPIPQYLLSMASDPEDQPVAQFLSVAELEKFTALLQAHPADALSELEEATEHLREADGLGWGDSLQGELIRRKRAGQRQERARAVHPAGKLRMPRLAIATEIGGN